MNYISAMTNSRTQQAVAKQSGPAEAVNQLFYFTRRLQANAEKLADNLQFNKEAPSQVCLVSLYLSLLELTGAFLLLIEKKCHILLPSTIRSILETYVEYENLRKDDLYIKDMEYSKLGQDIKILEAAKAGTNPFLSDIAKLEPLDQLVKDYKERRIQLRKGKAKSHRINERFNKAGFTKWYDQLYGFLSGNTPACVSATFYRNFAQDGDGVSIVHGRMPSPERMLPHLDLTAEVLLESSQKIHDCFGGEKKATFKEFEETLAAIRKKYPDHSDHRDP